MKSLLGLTLQSVSGLLSFRLVIVYVISNYAEVIGNFSFDQWIAITREMEFYLSTVFWTDYKFVLVFMIVINGLNVPELEGQLI
jgi:hypothetical protein